MVKQSNPWRKPVIICDLELRLYLRRPFYRDNDPEHAYAVHMDLNKWQHVIKWCYPCLKKGSVSVCGIQLLTMSDCSCNPAPLFNATWAPLPLQQWQKGSGDRWTKTSSSRVNDACPRIRIRGIVPLKKGHLQSCHSCWWVCLVVWVTWLDVTFDWRSQFLLRFVLLITMKNPLISYHPNGFSKAQVQNTNDLLTVMSVLWLQICDYSAWDLGIYCLEHLCLHNNFRAKQDQENYPAVWVCSGSPLKFHRSLEPGRQLLAHTARAPLSQAPQLFSSSRYSGAELGTDEVWNCSVL